MNSILIIFKWEIWSMCRCCPILKATMVSSDKKRFVLRNTGEAVVFTTLQQTQWNARVLGYIQFQIINIINNALPFKSMHIMALHLFPLLIIINISVLFHFSKDFISACACFRNLTLKHVFKTSIYEMNTKQVL